jgi:hypothetical protein
MENLFDKEKRKNIEKLNERMGTKHRSYPYDMNNPVDVEQALATAVAAYRDYWHYEVSLIKMTDDFDESLECLDTATWLDMGKANGEPDALSEECLDMLNQTSALFGQLAERAKEKLISIMTAALSLPPDAQKKVFGKAYAIKQAEVDRVFDDFFDMFGEVKYSYSIDGSFADFLKLIEEEWAAYAV